MNLVQINERLKDLPMQVVQQYANGMNPEVPPYLALGELQRREIAQKQMATAQGAAQGPLPSIKEQVEQKAGLMEAQGLRQQQMMQQMAQPRGFMPVPPGMPQPEDQPEAMARGGLAAVPVRRSMFEYAGGGIIAFQDGGSVAEKYERESREMGEGKRMQFSPDVQTYARQIRASENAEQDAYMRREQERQLAGSPMMNRPTPEANKVRAQRYSSTLYGTGYDLPEVLLPPTVENVFYDKEGVRQARPRGMSDEAWNKARRETSRTEQQPTSQGPGDPFVSRYPQSGLPAVAKAKTAATGNVPPAATGARPPVPPRPAAPAGIAAALPQAVQAPTNTSPLVAEAAAMAREKPVAPTPESIIEEQNKLLPPAMQEAAMQRRLADQRARAEQERGLYERSRPTGLDDLIRVFGQAGQYKGLSGTGPAYTSNIDRKRAEDLAFERRQNELLTAIEGREYEGAKELFGAREKALTAANRSFQERLTSNTRTLADLAGVDQRRIDEAANRLNQLEIQKLREATQNRSLNEKLSFEANYLRLKAQARDLAEKGDAPGAAKLEARANDMLNIRSGGGGTAAVGAGRNAIMDRRQTMSELQQIIKDEGMMYTDAEKKLAAAEYKRLAMMNVNEGAGGGGGFTVTAGGKTYTFPTQEAANKFKAEAGVK